MITEILTRQLDTELTFIYDNVLSFTKRFFTNSDAQLVADKKMTYYIAFQNNDIYIQKHWKDKDGNVKVVETEIPYDEYNRWWQDVQ